MKRYATASALALIAMAGPSFADVTPQQVWDDLETYYANSLGYPVTATETMDGTSLVLSDITFGVDIPEEDARVDIKMPQITLADNGDGTVTMTLPDSAPITVFINEDGEQVGEVVVEMTAPSFKALISGTEASMNYDISADQLGYTLTKLVAEGEEITRDMLRADVAMGPISGTMSVMNSDGLRSMAQEFSYGNLTYDLAFQEPGGSDAGMFKGMLNGLSVAGETAIPTDVDFEDPTALFGSGLMIDLVMAHQGGQTDFSVTERKGTTVGKMSSDAGEFGVAFSAEQMIYAVSATALDVELSGPELPLPISFAMQDLGFSFELPLKKSDAPQDASISLVLAEFTMADMLWNIFDPGAILPRDPATVAANLEAKVTPYVDLADEETYDVDVPGELNEVTLTDLVISAAGGTILGEGAFTFDNSDLDSFDGMPRPEGQLDFQISGANGLIDNLITMGLLPEQDAMGVRMMLGMFTVPGDEPDTATSSIVVNEQGHVLANGQRIK
ncbi:DUF2125 domain-containing protein [Tropicibacter naphthalenivorans]|uniref:DUF2125 domain-containing protein n=1 Tax=Tropicibacter naphthalenivorans TaxID=441103 RepID=A0A0P1GA10_9RHOB|nr:DUF2125 domain-containing protein [Tropicibacter naphthalenivorans]CUH78320.1 hypothetical protein TRN7648_01916 [Tropicibacter naphthalenivorans]SMC79272.1 hypothetical protein SAMN04488093_10478 [Tropicibacter naphthalenivorans]